VEPPARVSAAKKQAVLDSGASLADQVTEWVRLVATPAFGGRRECPYPGCAWFVDVPAPEAITEWERGGSLVMRITGIDPASVEAVLTAHAETHRLPASTTGGTSK
jgi:hypothetical protein